LDRLRGLSFASNPARPPDDPIPVEVKEPPAEFRFPGAGPNEFRPPDNLEELAQQRGWKFVKYKTRGSGGFDSSPSLFLLLVPGESYTPPRNVDQYIQFTLPADPRSRLAEPVPQGELPKAADYPTTRLARNFSMISMEKASGDRPARPYFQLFQQGGNGRFVRQPSDEDSCYDCHTSGLRAISPLGQHTRPGEPRLPDATRAMVDEINERMDSYGPIAWRNTRPELLGPPLGRTTPRDVRTRTEEFIRGCASTNRELAIGEARTVQRTFTQNTPPRIRWEKVRDAMNCQFCHDGANRGTLTSQTRRSMLIFKIVGDRTMPQGHDDLNDDERIALYNCLIAEQDADRVPWITEVACTDRRPIPAGAVNRRDRREPDAPRSSGGDTGSRPAR
jgi:hypothetical protein